MIERTKSEERKTKAGAVPVGAATTPPRPRAFVLLAGSLRSSRFRLSIGRSVLDLPVKKDRTLLELWAGLWGSACSELGFEDVPLRVVVDATGSLPESLNGRQGPRVSVEHDPVEYRGTAGVLRDLCVAYEPDDAILVANAMQLPCGSFAAQCRAVSGTGADVAIMVPGDGAPSSLMSIRCGVLANVPSVGFVDLKEQALPEMSKKHDVRAIRAHHPVTRPIRTLDDYLSCLRDLHLGRLEEGAGEPDPFEERWRPAFALVEQGARVDPTSRIQDSVVLAGAMVGPNATVVRSLVGPKGVVRRGRLVLSEIVGTPLRPHGNGHGSKAQA